MQYYLSKLFWLFITQNIFFLTTFVKNIEKAEFTKLSAVCWTSVREADYIVTSNPGVAAVTEWLMVSDVVRIP